MRYIALCLLGLLSVSFCTAQRLKFQWEPTPVVHKVSNPDFLKESAIMIVEKIQLDYSYGASGDPELRRHIHRIIRVNDEKGIEMYNKIRINYREGTVFKDLKARTILPSGKVIELKPDAFKDVKDEDGRMNKIFALEGVEKGAEIEYITDMTQTLNFYGECRIQDLIPTASSEFEIVSPGNLLFEVKAYNTVTLEKDSVMGEFNSYYAHAKNLPGLEEEKMASYLPHFARVEYSLAYNKDRKGSGIRILTWDDAAKNIYKNLNTFNEKELKSVGKMLGDQKTFAACKTEKEKIEWIENFVKTNYVQQDYVADEKAETIDFILKNKMTNESGIKVFFAALYQSQNIPFEVGYTTDRFSKSFDYSFQNWDNLEKCVFYFPGTKQYMAPTEIGFRIPFIPANWCGNDAMFYKVLKLGDVVTSSAEKRRIPELPAGMNYHNHDVEVNFNTDMDTALIKMKNVFAGYNALELMPVFVFLEKEKRDEVTKNLLQLSDKEEKMDQFTYENNEFSTVTKDQPMTVSAKIYATGNIEKAGNKYLFKAGELIGRQSEMYQEKERQFDIEIPNAHQYTRILKIHIPKGYKAGNLDKFNMNVVTKVGGKEICRFVSSYTQNADLLEVKVFEVYETTYIPKSEYENYRKVINAAADFNKIVIVLEKI